MIPAADEAPWNRIPALLDDSWFVDCDIDVAMDRIFRRQTGHGITAEASRKRIAENDRPNGELILSSAARAKLLVPSLPFIS